MPLEAEEEEIKNVNKWLKTRICREGKTFFACLREKKDFVLDPKMTKFIYNNDIRQCGDKYASMKALSKNLKIKSFSKNS